VKPIHIIGVPLDLGGARRGVDIGPSAMRIAGLGESIARLGRQVIDKGNLPVPIAETEDAIDTHKNTSSRSPRSAARCTPAVGRRSRPVPFRSSSAATIALPPARSPRVPTGLDA
jgi:arginase family enzyme